MENLIIEVVPEVSKIKQLTRTRVEELLENYGFVTKDFKGIKLGVLINAMFNVDYSTSRAKNGRLVEFRAYTLKKLNVNDVKDYVVDMLTNDTYKMTNVAYFNEFIKPNLQSDEVRKVAKDLLNVTYRANHKKELK